MSEASFAAALLDPAWPVPPGLVRPDGLPADKRFAVYRNNVAVSLSEGLQAGFPVVKKLVGEAFFTAMAGEFLRTHPPRGRIMMLYGDEFAGFLANFPPVAAYPYLPDVARIEQSLRESFHAGDAEPLPVAAFGIPEAELLTSRLSFAPALRLVRSNWPIHAIWRFNTEGGPSPVPGPQDVLILRPEFDPRPRLLPPGGGQFMEHLLAGAPLVQALSASPPDFNLSAVLTLLLNGRAITGLHP